MYFYHEGYYDAYYADPVLDDLRSEVRREHHPNYEPIRTPAILNWLAVVSVAICVIFAAIQALS